MCRRASHHHSFAEERPLLKPLQLLRCDLAHHYHRGCFQAVLAQGGKRSAYRALIRTSSPANSSRRRIGRHPSRQQPLGNRVPPSNSHQNHKRPAELRCRFPIGRRCSSIWCLMSGDDRHRSGRMPQGYGDARIGGGGESRCDARNNLKTHPSFRQSRRFLAASCKHQRVAALQPHHIATSQPVLHEQLVDLLLRHPRLPRQFPHINTLSLSRRHIQHRPHRQPVIHHHIRLRQHLRPPQSKQPRIPRPCAKKINRHASSLVSGVSKAVKCSECAALTDMLQIHDQTGDSLTSMPLPVSGQQARHRKAHHLPLSRKGAVSV